MARHDDVSREDHCATLKASRERCVGHLGRPVYAGRSDRQREKADGWQ